MEKQTKIFCVALPRELHAWVKKRIDGVKYASADEVMRDAVVALQDRERKFAGRT